jgi:hypothetical protein
LYQGARLSISALGRHDRDHQEIAAMWMSKLSPRRSEDPVRSAVAIDALLEELRMGLQHVEVARRTQSEPTAARARARSEAVLRSAREQFERTGPLLGPAPYARAAIGIRALEDALKALDDSRPAIRM